MPTEFVTTTWKTFDGATFLTFEEAKNHEDLNFAALLVGMTAEQVAAALDRKPEALALADALEKAGNIIARKRRESGELRRARNGEGKAASHETAPEPEPTPEPEARADAEAV